MNIKFVVSAVYSVLAVCGIFCEMPGIDAADVNQNFIGPVYQKCAEKSDNVPQIFNLASGLYVPGFDINHDGVLNNTDIEQIYITRRETKRSILQKIVEESEKSEEAVQEEVSITVDAEDEPLEAPEVTEITAVTEEPAVTEAEEEEITEPAMPEPREMRGIDVSKWQGRIDWQRVKDAGIEFVIIKAGEGTQVAKNFYTNINGAKEAGIPCGIYWFSNAKSSYEAVAEANACLEVASQYQLEFPVVCDFEYRSIEKCGNPLEKNKAAATEAVLSFLGTIEEGGYYSMIYTNKNFSSKYLEFDRISSEYDVWCAGYNVSSPGLPCGIWQHSQTGKVDGIDMDSVKKADVDLDIAYRDYPAIMKHLHINGY